MQATDRLKRQLAAGMTSHLSGNPTPVPEAGRLVWQWFIDLSETRTWHQAGPNPISLTEISAWASMYRWPLQPHHVDLIRALDDAWRAHFYEASKREHETKDMKKVPERSEQKLTPELFDAMFGG